MEISISRTDIHIDSENLILKLPSKFEIHFNNIKLLKLSSPHNLTIVAKWMHINIQCHIECHNSNERELFFIELYRGLHQCRKLSKQGMFYEWPTMKPIVLSFILPYSLAIGDRIINLRICQIHLFVGNKHPTIHHGDMALEDEEETIFSLQIDHMDEMKNVEAAKVFHLKAINAITRTNWLTNFHQFVQNHLFTNTNL